MKTCVACHNEKPLDGFYRHSGTRDGRNSWCKTCSLAAQRDRRRARAEADAREQRERRARDPERMRVAREASRRWHREHPEARRAHALVQRAVLAGRLMRPDRCGECDAIGRVQGHHEDYGRPLDVEWLCALCHRKRHASEAA